MNAGPLSPPANKQRRPRVGGGHGRRKQMPDGRQGQQERRRHAACRTSSGGRTGWTCRSSTNTLLCPIPLAKNSTTPRNSETICEGPEIRTCLRCHDHVAEVVAGQLRPLRTALHSDGLAQRGTYRIATAGAASPTAPSASRRSTVGSTTSLIVRQQFWPFKEVRQEDLLGDLMILAGNCTLNRWASKHLDRLRTRRRLEIGVGCRLGAQHVAGGETLHR